MTKQKTRMKTETRMDTSSVLDLLNKKEPLCEELSMYRGRSKSFEVIQHPLVFSVPYSETENALLNHTLKVKQEMANKYMDEEDWGGYVFLHETPCHLSAFEDISANLSSKEYWSLLGEIWVLSENIWQNQDKWQELLTSCRPDKEYFMEEEDRKYFNSLPDTITIHRGYKENKNGFSYSLSEEKAQWFANRWKKEGVVITRTIKKEDAFAYMGGRKESEIITLKEFEQ